MAYATVNGGPAVAAVLRDRRDHTLEVHFPGGRDPVVLELEGVNRPPQAIMPGDFDRDGATDLMLFTPNEPMVLVRGLSDSEGPAFEALTDDRMPQYGLVNAAGPDNTAMLDVDDDGDPELLIADENFVRACAFDAERGWRVVDQVTVPQAGASFAGLAVLRADDGQPLIVASDRGNRRLAVISRADDGAWHVADKLRLDGFDLGAIRAGAFSGDREPNVLCLSAEAFAIVKLGGARVLLEEVAAYRSDEEDRLEHEMEVGDVNGDGYTDLVVLDAREQMCQVFTLSAARKLYLATEFKVFESRLFSRGDARQYEPSAALIGDLTGNGAADLTLQVHDRYLLFPQMTR